MTALIVILIVLFLVFLLLMQWFKIRIYGEEKIAVKIGIGPVMLDASSFSGKKKKEKKAPEKGGEKSGEKKGTKEKKEKKEKKEGAAKISDVINILKEILPRFCKKLHFRARTLEITVATGDAASTAIACGATKAASSLMFELIDTYTVLDIGKRDRVSIEPNFLSEKSAFKIDLLFRIRLISALALFPRLISAFIKTADKN